MSPEQIMGARLDARSDLYSASVVLYEAVTTRLPFEGNSSSEILTSALHAPLLPPRVLRESCPAELEAVILRGLRRNPEERFPNALLMASEIEQIAAARGLPLGAEAFRAPVSMLPRPNTTHEAQTERALALPRPKTR
jgi:serine/threonine protein kinase